MSGSGTVGQCRQGVEVGVAADVSAALEGGVEVVTGETQPEAEDQAADERAREDPAPLGRRRYQRERRRLDDTQPEQLALLHRVGQPRLLGRTDVGRVGLLVELHLPLEAREVEALAVEELGLLAILLGRLPQRILAALERGE